MNKFIAVFIIALGLYYLLYLAYLDPLEFDLIWTYVKRADELPVEFTQQCLYSVNRLVVVKHHLFVRFLVILGVILYPFLLPIWLLWKALFGADSVGDHKLYVWDKLFRHLGRPLSFPEFGTALYQPLTSLVLKGNSGVGEFDLYTNKLYWYKLFQSNGVKTPEIFGVFQKGALEGRVPEKMDLIVKPLRGCCGNDVIFWRYDAVSGLLYDSVTSRRISVEDLILEYKDKKYGYVVQKRIVPNKNLARAEYPQHLRIVTYRTPAGRIQLLTVVLLISRAPNVITSNGMQGAVAYNVSSLKFELDGKPIPFLVDSIKLARKLHEGVPLFSIGWDVIIADDGAYFVEGNFMHGSEYYSLNNYYETVDTYRNAFLHYYKKSFGKYGVTDAMLKPVEEPPDGISRANSVPVDADVDVAFVPTISSVAGVDKVRVGDVGVGVGVGGNGIGGNGVGGNGVGIEDGDKRPITDGLVNSLVTIVEPKAVDSGSVRIAYPFVRDRSDAVGVAKVDSVKMQQLQKMQVASEQNLERSVVLANQRKAMEEAYRRQALEQEQMMNVYSGIEMAPRKPMDVADVILNQRFAKENNFDQIRTRPFRYDSVRPYSETLGSRIGNAGAYPVELG